MHRKLVLHNQIDGLLSAIAQRPGESSSGPRPATSHTPRHEFVSQFKVAMVGDSTMRVRMFEPFYGVVVPVTVCEGNEVWLLD